MAFRKTGEIKVYKKGNKVGPKFASKDKSNRFTIDDLVKQSDEDVSVDTVVTSEELDKTEDVSN